LCFGSRCSLVHAWQMIALPACVPRGGIGSTRFRAWRSVDRPTYCHQAPAHNHPASDSCDPLAGAPRMDVWHLRYHQPRGRAVQPPQPGAARGAGGPTRCAATARRSMTRAQEHSALLHFLIAMFGSVDVSKLATALRAAKHADELSVEPPSCPLRVCSPAPPRPCRRSAVCLPVTSG
jgi:hypothetical protein